VLPRDIGNDLIAAIAIEVGAAESVPGTDGIVNYRSLPESLGVGTLGRRRIDHYLVAMPRLNRSEKPRAILATTDGHLARTAVWRLA